MLKRLIKVYGFTMTAVLISTIFLSIPPAIAAEPDYIASGRVLAGNIYLKSGDITSALREFESAHRDNPSNPDALIGLIRCYARGGEYDKAWNLLEEFEAKRSSDMRYHLIRAEMLALKGHCEEASNEFVILIEKGVYRFEALQGLINLYVENGDNQMKRIIDTSISLYEPVNQIALYKVLVTGLDNKGRTDELKEYLQKLEAVTDADSKKYEERFYSDINPLEYIIDKASGLLEEGSVEEAEILLADASKRWPGDYRVQELLKRCYFALMQDVPVIYRNDEAASAMGASNLIQKTDFETPSLISSLLNEMPISSESKSYISTIENICGQTEQYYVEMIDKLQSWQQKVMADISIGGIDCQTIQNDLRDLNLLISESLKVSKQEGVTLKGVMPPKGFEKSHSLLIDIADIRTKLFEDIQMFVNTRQMSYMERAIANIDKGDKLVNDLITELNKACIEEIKKAPKSDAEDNAEKDPGIRG